MFWTNIDTFLEKHFLELSGLPTKQEKKKLANSLKNHFWWYFEETKFTNIKKFFKKLVDNIQFLYDIDDYIQIIVTDTHFFGSFRDNISCIKILSYKLYCEELLQTCLLENELKHPGFFTNHKKTMIETKIKNIKLVLRSFFNNKRLHELASSILNGGTTSELLVTTNGSIQTTRIPFNSGSIIIDSSVGFDEKSYCFIVQDISFDLNKDKNTLEDIMINFDKIYKDEITEFNNEQSRTMLDVIEEESRFSSTSTVPANHSEKIRSNILSRTGDYTSFKPPAAGSEYPDPELVNDTSSSTSTIGSIHSKNESDEDEYEEDEYEEDEDLHQYGNLHEDENGDGGSDGGGDGEKVPLLHPSQSKTDEIEPSKLLMMNPLVYPTIRFNEGDDEKV